jgi:dCMP deaminase
MPTILLLGPQCSGKHTIADYLALHEGFERVQLANARPAIASTLKNIDDSSLTFLSASDFLDYATLNWRKRYVCCDVRSRQELDPFIKRPWVLLVGCEAGIMQRWRRCNNLYVSFIGGRTKLIPLG